MAKRFLRLPSEPVVGDNEVVVEVPHNVVPTVALELSLLLAGLAESLRMQAESGPIVALTIGAVATASKALVFRNDAKTLSFEFGRNQVEYLHAVLLRTHRDGVAEVSHVHIEATNGEAPFDLTILFETYREPMSAEQAMDLLGD